MMTNNAPDDSAMDGQPEPDSDDQGGSTAMEMCVPLSSLREPDENEQMTTPEAGNPVTMTVEGTISRVEGPNAYITPTAVNGQDVTQEAPMDEEGDLRNQAAAMGPNY